MGGIINFDLQYLSQFRSLRFLWPCFGLGGDSFNPLSVGSTDLHSSEMRCHKTGERTRPLPVERYLPRAAFLPTILEGDATRDCACLPAMTKWGRELIAAVLLRGSFLFDPAEANGAVHGALLRLDSKPGQVKYPTCCGNVIFL